MVSELLLLLLVISLARFFVSASLLFLVVFVVWSPSLVYIVFFVVVWWICFFLRCPLLVPLFVFLSLFVTFSLSFCLVLYKLCVIVCLFVILLSLCCCCCCRVFFLLWPVFVQDHTLRDCMSWVCFDHYFIYIPPAFLLFPLSSSCCANLLLFSTFSFFLFCLQVLLLTLFCTEVISWDNNLLVQIVVGSNCCETVIFLFHGTLPIAPITIVYCLCCCCTNQFGLLGPSTDSWWSHLLVLDNFVILLSQINNCAYIIRSNTTTMVRRL